MSIKVMTWIWDHSPASGTELLMLLAIADHADDYGRNAWPSRTTLARKTRLDERTVRRVIKRLEDGGHLAIERGTGRSHSNRYTVVMHANQAVDNSTIDGDLDGEEREADCPPGNPPRGGVPRERGALCPERGVAAPPEPSRTIQEPSSSPEPADRQPSLTSTPAEEEAEGIETRAMEVLSQLGPQWRLTQKQQRTLTRLAAHALQRGWSVTGLADYLSANPDGVRSPAAVLTARLNDLPGPQEAAEKPTQRPIWCGRCDEAARHIETPDGRPARCPDCHPLRTHPTEVAS